MFDPGRVAGIAFDLDGTLLDSAPDIAHALDAALGREGLPAFDLATVRGWIGDGPDALIAKALAAHGIPAADLGLRQRLRSAFDEVTLAAPLAHGFVYQGIEAMLARLNGIVPMAVVTNKPTLLARSVLSAAGLIEHFSSVHGADTAAQRKPAPVLLHAAAAGLRVEPVCLLMVGDGLADVHAARAAACPMVWVSWGYGATHAGSEPRPRQVDSPQELLSLILPSKTAVTNP